MKVDVFTPDDHVGDVIGDLNRRRGMIQGQESGPTGVRIKAEAPLSEMFGYSTDLRSKTQGKASFTMEFSAYKAVPSNVQEQLVAKHKEDVAKGNK